MLIKNGLAGLVLGCAILSTIINADDSNHPAVDPGTLQLLLLNDPICDPPGDFFSGPYLMEQLSGQDPFYASETFGDTQIVNIVAVGNKRSFDFLYFPGIFDSDYNFTMRLDCGKIRVIGRINSGGLGCGGANIGFGTGIPISTHTLDEFEDVIMLVNVSDFLPDGNCDRPPYQVELRFTKQ